MHSEGLQNESIRLLDIGAGSGYFVSACDDLKIQATGIDMSKAQVVSMKPFVHTQNGGSLQLINGDDLARHITESDANVVSAIGVLEHVIDLHEIMKSIVENPSIKYLYISVPMFGLSNILETLLPDVYNRHLGGVHTHVFSQSSISYMCELYQMEMIGKWQFGTDMMDLYRMCMVKNNGEIGEIISSKFWKCLDDMQLVLDHNDFCSEIHAVFKFKRK